MDPSPGPVPDAELVARVAAGDESAFGEVYDRYAQAVFGSAARLLGDRGAAEEVVQETWLTLWNRADRYDAARGSLVAWLLAIARNRSMDRFRAARRQPALVPIGSTGDEPDDAALERALAAGEPIGTPDTDVDPEAAATRRWTRAVVRSVLSTLPDAERMALELAYDDGLSQAEIAARTGWPLGTVKTRTRRGLLRLREALGDTLDESTGGVRGAR